MAFVSPEKSDVVGNADKANAVVAFRNALPSSSYGVIDSGWKKQFDIHNQTDRFIPLNADIAGLTVLTQNQLEHSFHQQVFLEEILEMLVLLHGIHLLQIEINFTQGY